MSLEIDPHRVDSVGEGQKQPCDCPGERYSGRAKSAIKAPSQRSFGVLGGDTQGRPWAGVWWAEGSHWKVGRAGSKWIQFRLQRTFWPLNGEMTVGQGGSGQVARLLQKPEGDLVLAGCVGGRSEGGRSGVQAVGEWWFWAVEDEGACF